MSSSTSHSHSQKLGTSEYQRSPLSKSLISDLSETSLTQPPNQKQQHSTDVGPVGEDMTEGVNNAAVIRFLTDMSQMQSLMQDHDETENISGEEIVNPSLASKNAQELDEFTVKLRQVFGLPETETIEGEYTCWLLRNVLLQGFMYLTQHYLLFFAHIPTENAVANKAGFLSKRSSRTRMYSRYWFVLQGGRLSYYEDSQQLYFPVGTIDLRTIVRFEAHPSHKNGFKLIGTNHSYHFEAGSEQSYLEWKKVIELALFQISQEGQNVKVMVQLSKLYSVEVAPNYLFSNALLIKALEDSDYAIDEYYFMFFKDINKTKDHIQKLWNACGHAEDKLPDRHRQSFSSLATSSSSELNSQRHSWWGLDDVPEAIGSMFWNVKQYLVGEEDPQTLRANFGLPANEEIYAHYAVRLEHGIPRFGRLYITATRLCFEARYPVRGMKVVIPFTDIDQVQKKSTMFFSHSLLVGTNNHQEFIFDFSSKSERDSAHLRLVTASEKVDSLHTEIKTTSITSKPDADNYELITKEENVEEKQVANPFYLQDSSVSDSLSTMMYKLPHDEHVLPDQATLQATATMAYSASAPTTKPIDAPKHITLMTIGSRGDVQPLVALGKSLLKHGHLVRIATHLEFGDWVRSHGIEFFELPGNPADLLELMTQHSVFSPAFINRAVGTFLSWFDQLLAQSWRAVQGTDMVIAAPYCFSGFHVAEALGVPFFYVCPFPWTRTRAFPSPLITPESNMGGSFNYLTHVALETVLWRALSPKINNWRKNILNIPAISSLKDSKTPVLNCFSSQLIPPPPDWNDFVHICGFFFLDNPTPNWQPSKEVLDFVNDKEKKVIYIGFGSVVVDDPEALINTIVKGINLAGVKAILASGWSDRAKNTKVDERQFPDYILSTNAIPHDWLFPKMACVIHHGGAGTTAAGLRAGAPTIIKPFFGDQFFWGERVAQMGVGLVLRELTVDGLSHAIQTVLTDQKLIAKARQAGKIINKENGVETAIHAIYRDLEYARDIATEQKKLHQGHQEVLKAGEVPIEHQHIQHMHHRQTSSSGFSFSGLLRKDSLSRSLSSASKNSRSHIFCENESDGTLHVSSESPSLPTINIEEVNDKDMDLVTKKDIAATERDLAHRVHTLERTVTQLRAELQTTKQQMERMQSLLNSLVKSSSIPVSSSPPQTQLHSQPPHPQQPQ